MFGKGQKIENIFLIDGPKFIGPEMNYSENNFGKNVILMPSFNFLDNFSKMSVQDYNNTEIKKINAPALYENQSWVKIIKIYSKVSHKEACRIFNHVSCWIRCIELNKPIIVLEWGAKLHEDHAHHFPRGSINALGNEKLHQFNSNLLCNPSPWAYSIDPVSAKILFENLLSNGIVDTLPLLMSINKICIVGHKKAHRIKIVDISRDVLTYRL